MDASGGTPQITEVRANSWYLAFVRAKAAKNLGGKDEIQGKMDEVLIHEKFKNFHEKKYANVLIRLRWSNNKDVIH